MERQLRGEPSVNISNSSEILALRMPAYTPVKVSLIKPTMRDLVITSFFLLTFF